MPCNCTAAQHRRLKTKYPFSRRRGYVNLKMGARALFLRRFLDFPPDMGRRRRPERTKCVLWARPASFLPVFLLLLLLHLLLLLLSYCFPETFFTSFRPENPPLPPPNRGLPLSNWWFRQTLGLWKRAHSLNLQPLAAFFTLAVGLWALGPTPHSAGNEHRCTH